MHRGTRRLQRAAACWPPKASSLATSPAPSGASDGTGFKRRTAAGLSAHSKSPKNFGSGMHGLGPSQARPLGRAITHTISRSASAINICLSIDVEPVAYTARAHKWPTKNVINWLWIRSATARGPCQRCQRPDGGARATQPARRMFDLNGVLLSTRNPKCLARILGACCDGRLCKLTLHRVGIELGLDAVCHSNAGQTMFALKLLFED
jgi:hypothetical protein